MKIAPLALFASMLTLTSVADLHAQLTSTDEEQQLEPVFWPKDARPKLNATSFHTDFDGIDVQMLHLQVDSLAFQLTDRKTLRIRESGSYRYSAEITDSRIPGVSLGISVFKKGEFLENLSEESWNAYKAGIAIEKPDAKIVLENTNIEQALTPYVFGEQFRQIVYQQITSRGTIKRREIFAFVGSDLLVFTINGTEEYVDQNWTSVEHLIGEMSRS